MLRFLVWMRVYPRKGCLSAERNGTPKSGCRLWVTVPTMDTGMIVIES
jgi:hypothetical protein